MSDEKKRENWWLLAAIILTILPLALYPTILSSLSSLDEATAEQYRLLVKLYPLAVVAYAVCSWLCRRDRAYLSWILVVLSLLSSTAILSLC